MGSYLTLDPVGCTVYLTAQPKQGSSQYFSGLPTVLFRSWSAQQFALIYPGYITVPAHCKTAILPPNNWPKPDPEDGGEDEPPWPAPEKPRGKPPAEDCGEGYASDMATLDAQINEDTVPIVAGLTPLNVVLSDKAAVTQAPHFEVRTGDAHAIIDAIHEATGPGMLCLHPPELQDYHLRGAIDNADAGWPTALSETCLLFLNSLRADASDGDPAATMLGFGIPLRDTTKPGDGWYMKLNLADGNLEFQATDSAGADTNTPTLVVNGTPIGSGGGGSDGFAYYMGARG